MGLWAKKKIRNYQYKIKFRAEPYLHLKHSDVKYVNRAVIILF